MSQASALDPSGVIPPTSYVVSMWIEAHSMSDNTGDGGFQYWAEIAGKVNASNAVSSSCMMETPSRLGVPDWIEVGGRPFDNVVEDGTLTTCTGGGWGNVGANGAFANGQGLAVSVTINSPTDDVALAAVVDDLPKPPPASASPSGGANLLNAIGSSGKALAAAGAVLSVAFPEVSLVVGTIGAAIDFALSLPQAAPLPPSSPTCAGGPFPNQNGSSDTLLAHLSGQQLDELAQGGTEMLLHPSGQGSSAPALAYCSSDLTVHLSVARDWSTGLAAAPRSSDFAIVSTQAQENLFVVPQTLFAGAGNATNQFLGYRGASSTWSAPIVTAGVNGYSPVDEGVDGSTTGALVQTAVPDASCPGGVPCDEFLFWADASGKVRMGGYGHAAAQMGYFDQFPEYTVAFSGTFPSSICTNGRFGRICTTSQVNLVPKHARVAALSLQSSSRRSSQLDAFFIDARGNVQNLYSSDWGHTWGSMPATSDGAGVPGSPLVAVARTPWSADVFFLGKGGLEHVYWSQNAWKSEIVSGTQSHVVDGGHLTAIAPTVADLDVFFVDSQGVLWRAYESTPAQPTLVASPVSSVAEEGFPGGAIAAVSRQPGEGPSARVMDVVFEAWNSSSARWYSTQSSGTVWSHGRLSGAIDVSDEISIVAPDSFSLQVLVKNYWSNVYTSQWVSTGVPSWSTWRPIETLTPEN